MIKIKSLKSPDQALKYIVLAMILLGALFSTTEALTPEQKTLKNALKRGNSDYFQKITKASLDTANAKNSKGRSVIQRYGIRAIPALIGGFSNPDVEVRKEIYRELLFPKTFKKLGDQPLRKLSKHPETKLFLSMIRDNVFNIKETDLEAEDLLNKVINRYNYSLREAINKRNYKSVALMSPDFFKESNAEHKLTVVGRFGKRAVKTLVKAIGYEKGSMETKQLILETLLFKNTGGPEKVIPKLSTRTRRAEELYFIADKLLEKDGTADLSDKIIEVAEIYISNEFDSEG